MISRFPLVILILFFLLACQNNQTNIGINNNKNDCPINPEKLNNLKEISINEIAYTHSGMVKSGQDVGYKFRGKKGKNLELKTQSDICLWIYTPTGEKLNLDKSSKLPMDGNYIIQLSKNQGATTYDLILSLKQKKETNINISKSKPYIKEYILNHYKKLNDRQYQQSWQELTSNFQNNKAINYSEYTNWWNKVDYIEIKKIDVMEQEEEQAIIEVSIKYKMKTGRSFYDTNNQILIIWNSQKEIWQIDDKAYQIDNNKSKNDVSEAVNLIKNLYFDLSEKDFQSAKKTL